MRLNPDLVREILIEYEKLPYGGASENIQIEGHSEEELIYHTELLIEAGFLKAEIIQDLGNNLPDVIPERLTYSGHEFLEAARDEKRWGQVKKILIPTGAFILDVARAILIDLLRAQVSPQST